MSTLAQPTPAAPVIYPDSDGEPMAENTLQYDWIVLIKGNLDVLFRDHDNVFVAGDLLWYPIEGDNRTRVGPDVMVAFGRPKGYRGSYMQWVEDNIPPQVVFEIISPGNRAGAMQEKFAFYDRHGVEEYYIFDPFTFELKGWQRVQGRLTKIAEMNGWVSPRLRVRFELHADDLKLIGPNGEPFANILEIAEQRQQALAENARISREKDKALQEKSKAVHDKEKAVHDKIAAQQLAEKLAAQLRALGIEPEV